MFFFKVKMLLKYLMSAVKQIHEFYKINYSKHSPFYGFPVDLFPIIISHIIKDTSNMNYKSVNLIKLIRFNNVLLLKYICCMNKLHVIEYNKKTNLINIAIKKNNLHILKYLHTMGFNGDDESVNLSINAYYYTKNNKIGKSNLTVLKYLHEVMGLRGNDKSMFIAIKHNNLPMIKYLSEHAYIINDISFDKCVKNKNLNIIKFIHENNLFTNRDNANKYLINSLDNITILKYLYETMGFNEEIDDSIMNIAIWYYDETIITYLHKVIGMGFNNKYYYEYYIKKNNLHMIKYLYEHKCKYDLNGMYINMAILNNNLEMIKYLYNTMGINGINDSTEDMCIINSIYFSIKMNNLEILKYLYHVMKLKPFEESLCCAAEYSDLIMVKYLYEVIGITNVEYFHKWPFRSTYDTDSYLYVRDKFIIQYR